MSLENTFKNPHKNFRPKMRWWLPGAFMEAKEIKREIIEMNEAGYGGAEVLYFMSIPTADVVPEKYGDYYFGSEKWNECMKVALETAIEHNFKLDFTVGPLWPIATPAILDKDDERAAHGLHIGSCNFVGSYKGKLPVPETIDQDRNKELVAVSVAKKTMDTHAGTLVTYEFESAQVLSIDSEDELVKWTAPDHGEWTLFTYWDQASAQMNDSAHAPVIDHLSEEATKAVTNYWDDFLLSDPYLKKLYEQNGGDLFCDSLEVNATMHGGMYDGDPLPVILWTPQFLAEFKERRGYDLKPYLLVLYIKGLYQHTDNRNLDRHAEYEFNSLSTGHQIRNDYYQTLTDLVNEKHISILQSWAHRHNMQLRYQIYGLPTDLTSGLMNVDVPESESLGFHDNSESVRLLSGAVHMGRKPVYSYELGAVQGQAYQQQWNGRRGLLWQMHQSMAGGVNQVVLHGMSYNTESVIGPVEPIFKWPGLSLMGTMYSNEWGNRQPIFQHSKMMTDYIGRLQYILQLGKPSVDLAIYRHEYDGVNYLISDQSSSFQQAGFTYDFISPALLQLEHATVGIVDGIPVLDPTGCAYKAIIIEQPVNRETNQREDAQVSVEVLEKFIQFAREGLPIIWVGEAAYRTTSFLESNDKERINSLFIELMGFSNVYVVKRNDFYKIAIPKAVKHDPFPHLVKVERKSNLGSFLFLYNQSKENKFTGNIEVEGKGLPYVFDAWTGEILLIDSSETTDNGVKVHLELEPNETKVIAIGNFIENGTVNSNKNIDEVLLDDWHLKINSWEAGETPTSTVIKEYTCHLDSLVPWKEIPGFERLSGVGLYETTITIPDHLSKAILELGDFSDTAKVIINGEHIVVNQLKKEVDITQFINVGKNVIQIEVATTLHNALTLYDKSKSPVDYGLFGPVKLWLGKEVY